MSRVSVYSIYSVIRLNQYRKCFLIWFWGHLCMGIFKQFGFSLSGRQKAELLEVEAILAASTFIFPYKIHVPMLVVWGSECLYLNFRSQNTCRSHKIWQKKAHSWVQHKNQSKINTVGGEASQNTWIHQDQGRGG